MKRCSLYGHLPSRERTAARKADRLCVDCECSLPDGHEFVRCDDCVERARIRSLNYARKNAKTMIAKSKAWRAANPEKYNQRMKEYRIRRYDEGRCASCPDPRDGESSYCKKHHEQHNASSLAHYNRTHGRNAA